MKADVGQSTSKQPTQNNAVDFLVLICPFLNGLQLETVLPDLLTKHAIPSAGAGPQTLYLSAGSPIRDQQ